MTSRRKARAARRKLKNHDQGNDRHSKARSWDRKRDRLTTEHNRSREGGKP